MGHFSVKVQWWISWEIPLTDYGAGTAITACILCAQCIPGFSSQCHGTSTHLLQGPLDVPVLTLVITY